MPSDVPYIYALFRSKGHSHELALAIALHCCDPSQPAPGWTHHKEETQ